MADIVNFPQSKQQQARHLEHWVTEVIRQHPDAKVAARWESMAVRTCQRFPGPPQPSQHNLSLDTLKGLDEPTQEAVLDAVQDYIQSYFLDVNAQLMEVHGELLTLQKLVAENAEEYDGTETAD